MNTEAALASLTLGLDRLRASWGYRETRKRAAAAGVSFSSTSLGRSEAALMVTPPTRSSVKRGRDLLHGSWAWNRTKAMNVVDVIFQRTMIAQADGLFSSAYGMLPFDTLGIFAANGVQCVNPRGGTENSEEFAAAGFKLASYNVGDYAPEEWENWHVRMWQGGIKTGPWARIYVPTDMDRLCSIAADNAESFVIHNVEKEIESTVPVSEILAVVNRYPNLRHAVQPEPWCPDDVRLEPLADAGVVILIEAYLNADPRFTPAALVQHAYDQGADLVSVTFGAGQWGDAPYNVPPATYFAAWPRGPYWVYPIDGKDAQEWRRP